MTTPPDPPLRLLRPDELDPAQRELYDRITGGPRSRSPIPLTDAEGRLTGPFNALLHAPVIGDAVQHLGAQLRFGSALTGRERELATLLVAGHAGCAYEIDAHRRLGAAAGLPPDALDALAAGRVPPLDDARERRVADFCSRLAGGTPPPEVVADAVASLGEPLVVELVVLVGYYQLVARLLGVAGVTGPAG